MQWWAIPPKTNLRSTKTGSGIDPCHNVLTGRHCGLTFRSWIHLGPRKRNLVRYVNAAGPRPVAPVSPMLHPLMLKPSREGPPLLQGTRQLGSTVFARQPMNCGTELIHIPLLPLTTGEWHSWLVTRRGFQLRLYDWYTFWNGLE